MSMLCLITWLQAVLNWSTLRPLIVGGLIKKRGLAIFPEEINGEGINKWKWVDFVMQFLNRGVVDGWGVTLFF